MCRRAWCNIDDGPQKDTAETLAGHMGCNAVWSFGDKAQSETVERASAQEPNAHG